MNYNDDRHIDNGMRHAGLVPSKSERNEARLQDRIAELEAKLNDANEWNEQLGEQVMADAAKRLRGRIAELEHALKLITEPCNGQRRPGMEGTEGQDMSKCRDGTDMLCRAVYGREAKAGDYLGGSEASMLYDAAKEIHRLDAQRGVNKERIAELEQENQRLREALEAIADEEYHTYCQVIARTALDAK